MKAPAPVQTQLDSRSNIGKGKGKMPQTPLHQKSQSNTGMMFIMSEKGGDAGLDFRFDNQSNGSGHHNVRNMGATGGAHSDDNNLLELMVMQNAADAIRQEYIEEPSYHKSMFNAPLEDISVTRGVEIPQAAGTIMMIVAFVAFGLVTMLFKAVYLNYRHTIWEDIYGRGIAFFVCATF